MVISTMAMIYLIGFNGKILWFENRGKYTLTGFNDYYINIIEYPP